MDSTFQSTRGALSFLFIVNIVLILGIGLGLGLGLALELVLHDKRPTIMTAFYTMLQTGG